GNITLGHIDQPPKRHGLVGFAKGADTRCALSRLEARVRSLEGQGVRSDRRAAELAGLAQALTDEQRALLIRLDRVEDLKRRDCQVPEERMARLEQEQRSLALELRLSASVAEEAQQKQLQRLRTLEDVCDHRLHALEQGPRLSRRGAHSQVAYNGVMARSASFK
ncbi:unnamed protein product, partial [Effrenium voratum]